MSEFEACQSCECTYGTASMSQLVPDGRNRSSPPIANRWVCKIKDYLSYGKECRLIGRWVCLVPHNGEILVRICAVRVITRVSQSQKLLIPLNGSSSAVCENSITLTTAVRWLAEER